MKISSYYRTYGWSLRYLSEFFTDFEKDENFYDALNTAPNF